MAATGPAHPQAGDLRIVESAPAKINLTLKVLGRRPDGYHEIESLVAFAVDVADAVTLHVGRAAGVDCEGPFAGAIDGPNLALKALEHLSALEPNLRLGSVTIRKNLPVAAGIGGGSADAAAVLRAARRANPTVADTLDWTAVARELGADVPVCLLSRAAAMRGAGERLSRSTLKEPLFAVLANTAAPVLPRKTARVFHELDAPPWRGPDLPSQDADWDGAVRDGRNDLEAAAVKLMPEAGHVLDAIRSTRGCLAARLSGAGPTGFGLYATGGAAEAARLEIATSQPSWWVAASALA